MRRATETLPLLRRRPVPAGWWPDPLLLLALAGLTGWLAVGGVLLDVDQAVRDWCADHRPPAARVVAHVLVFVFGQGLPLTLLCLSIAVFLAWRHRSVRPVLPVLVVYFLTNITIGPLKLWSHRGYPADPGADAVELFSRPVGAATGTAYPSGHAVNAVVWYGVLAVLVGASVPALLRNTIRVVAPAAELVANTYIGFHWLTDMVAGLLLGLLLDRLLARVDWATIGPPRWLTDRLRR